jgi:hypothetical protein
MQKFIQPRNDNIIRRKYHIFVLQFPRFNWGLCIQIEINCKLARAWWAYLETRHLSCDLTLSALTKSWSTDLLCCTRHCINWTAIARVSVGLLLFSAILIMCGLVKPHILRHASTSPVRAIFRSVFRTQRCMSTARSHDKCRVSKYAHHALASLQLISTWMQKSAVSDGIWCNPKYETLEIGGINMISSVMIIIRGWMSSIVLNIRTRTVATSICTTTKISTNWINSNNQTQSYL